VAVRDLLREKPIEARALKTLLIRCDQAGRCVWQLYMKDDLPDLISDQEAALLPAHGGELIFSNPLSPASKITRRLRSFGTTILTDRILNTTFSYAAESFFQVNLPVYEMALRDMQPFASFGDLTAIDLYSGVGTIGLTIGGTSVTLIETDEYAVREMRRNIDALQLDATAVHSASESALDYITADNVVILDPPRAGLHPDLVTRMLESKPPRIIYLSCNPVTQARDVALLAEAYGIRHHIGYNFFPATPHIEHLIVLELAKPL
jgi:23S rRNA (uracil1939-C5)-methyltransferase